MKSEKWIQIPVAPKYEMNRRGDVRNIKTRRIVKPWQRKDRGHLKIFGLYLDEGKCHRKQFSQSSLLWLTHGIIPRRKDGVRLLVPVIVSRGNERYYFESCSKAAQFIAHRKICTPSGVQYHFSLRREEIYGWRINYQR